MASKQIPCATEQGICKRVSGNFFRGTGNLIEGTLTREQPKPAEPQYQGAVTINGFISPAYRGVFSTPLLPDRGERASHPAGISAAGFCRRAPRPRSLWWISLILMSLTLDRKVTLRDSRRQRDEPSPAKVLADGSTCETHCGCNRQGPAACAHA